jgi:hypothetical protein
VPSGCGAGAEALPGNGDGTRSRGAGDGVAEGHAGEGVSRVRQRCCRRGHRRLASLSGGAGEQGRGGFLVGGARGVGLAAHTEGRGSSTRGFWAGTKAQPPVAGHGAGVQPGDGGARSQSSTGRWRGTEPELDRAVAGPRIGA